MNLLPYFWIYMISICINFVMIFYIFRNRRANGATAFIIVLLCCSVWSFACALESSIPELSSKILWVKISYPAHAFGPLAWFIMILQLTEHQQLTSFKNIILLCIIPVVTVVLAMTNFHGLMWSESYLEIRKSIPVLVQIYGPWFWIDMIYATGLDVLSVFMAFRFWRRQAPHYAKRYACLVFPVIFVWIVNTAYLFKIGPSVDMTPIAWGATTPFIIWALFRNSMFDIIPIAREYVIENINSGIVLLDLKKRIVDINIAAAELFQCEPGKAIGLDASKVLKSWPELLRQVDENLQQNEFKISLKQNDNYYVASCCEVMQRNVVLGRMLIIRDITEEKLTQAELLITQRQMAIQDERERIARDLHDDIGQIMGFVNVQAQAIHEYLKCGQIKAAEGCLERLSEVARETHNNIRETILTMRGETAAKELIAARYLQKLEQEIILFERNSGIKVERNFKGINELNVWDYKSAVQISKIIQETLNNIRKHSEATKASIICKENENVLIVTISDNGKGFDVEKKIPGGHFGLLFMKERTDEMDGRLFVRSIIGEGTTVEFEIPLSGILIQEEL